MQIRDCVRMARTRHNIIGPTFEETRRIYWDDPTMLRSALPGVQDKDYKLNEQRMIVHFPSNGSVLQFYGGDDPKNLKGIDGQSFVFDEWSLQKLECWTLVVQPIVEQDPGRWVVFIYTPCGLNHATAMFDEAACVHEGGPLPFRGRAERCKPDHYAARLAACSYGENGELVVESGIFSLEALERIRNSPQTTRQIFEQEYMCTRVMEEEFTLVTTAMLMALPARLPEGVANCPRKARIISCDPAMGGDACVIYVFDGLQARPPVVLRTRDTMRIYGELVATSLKTGIVDFIVDCIGIGRGIVDRLREDGKYGVQDFNSSEEGSADTEVANKRAELWWYVMREVEAFRAERPGDPETLRQIPYASRYMTKRGRIQIVPKDQIRKQLGCSPDHAEAWAMGLYGLKMANQYQGSLVVGSAGSHRQYRQPEPVDPMAYCA